jgi:hypothetical protein
MFATIADQLLTWLSGQLARNEASKHKTNRSVRPVRVEDEDRPELVFCGTVDSGEGSVFGYGLSPEFAEGKFNLAVFLDPTIPHWVDPIPSKLEGVVAYQMDGPTRGGVFESVIVTCIGDQFFCSCWQERNCDHIRALRCLDIFTWFHAPYDLP